MNCRVKLWEKHLRQLGLLVLPTAGPQEKRKKPDVSRAVKTKSSVFTRKVKGGLIRDQLHLYATKTLSSFTRPHVVQHKRRYLAQCFCSSFPYNKSNLQKAQCKSSETSPEERTTSFFFIEKLPYCHSY